MSTDPAGIPADYTFTVFPPRHRAVTTNETAALNRRGRAYWKVTDFTYDRAEPGRHLNPDVALWVHAAEDNARVLDIIRDGAR